MAVDLEKVTSHYLALLTARRSRAILVPIAAIAVIFTLTNITDRAYQQPSSTLREPQRPKALPTGQDLPIRAGRVLMYPAKMLPDPEDVDGGGFQQGELLVKARDEYGVKLVPIQVQHRDGADDQLLAFTTLTKEMLASHFFVIQPDKYEFSRIQKAIKLAADDEYNMELLNKLYHDTATVLPHWPYTMMSSELYETNHTLYLGSDAKEWTSMAVMSQVRMVRISSSWNQSVR
ncbi:hypothetical protein ACHAPE_002365 [Trichoderma viride]